MPRVSLSWSPRVSDPTVRAYRVYGNPDREVPHARGALLVEVPGTEETATVDVAEGWWRFVVVSVKRQEIESPFEEEAVEERYVVARGSAEKPPTPVHAAGGILDVTGEGRFSVDPPRVSDVPHKVQVIAIPSAGASPGLGHLLAEFDQLPKGPQGADASRLPGRAWLPPGVGISGTRVVVVRGISDEGQPGPVSELTLPHLDEHERLERVVLATIDKATGNRVGFPAAAGTDGWEYAAGAGARLREIPEQGDPGWADWGAVGSGGLFSSLRNLGRYVDNAKIRTDEWDLGASVVFRLDLYHELQRHATSVWSTWPVALLRNYPMVPHEHKALRQTAHEGSASGGWLMRETLHGGHPRQPLRDFWWEVTVADTTPVPTNDSDWKRYEPGTMLKARYGRARLCMIEPTGWWQILTGNVVVAAVLGRAVKYVTASPEGATTAPRGSFAIRTDTSPKQLWWKSTQGGNTGWVQVPDAFSIDALTQETSIDPLADMVPVHDASAGAMRKALPAHIGTVVLDRVTADTTVNNDNTEQDAYRKQIPADTIGTARSLRLVLVGDYLNNSGSPSNLRVRLKFGSTTLCDDVTAPQTSSASRRSLRIEVELFADGATNAQIGWVRAELSAPSAASTGTGELTTSAGASHPPGLIGTAAEDSTGALDLAVTLQHGAADPQTEFRILAARLELI